MSLTAATSRRFSARGSPEAEARISEMVDRIARNLDGALPRRSYRSVVLLGGYGRGEGGVLEEGGCQKPHNNLDILLITRSHVNGSGAKQRADEALAPLVEEFGVGIDVGHVSDWRLRRSPCLVMWYEMRFGHQVLLGDEEFVRSLERFRAERIEAWDVRNLLVNRGTLLLINQLLLDQNSPSEEKRRAITRHGMKAVIGYGDALLFFLGHYHWSYEEKQRRMKRTPGVPETMRRRYDEAIEFRFRPRYGEHAARDLPEWNASLMRELGDVHLRCEALRLGITGLRWPDYPPHALRRALIDGPGGLQGVVTKARNLLRERCPGRPDGWRARLGLVAAGWRGRLPLLFPAVAYEIHAPRYRELVAEILDVEAPEPRILRDAYLRLWSRYGDPNLPSTLAALGASLNT